ncbi:MAG: hypothetical protein E4H27_02535 [Anaerolineales bacterium]|nr:MAG: hypothetical protein E4H27_02535 [Anaerolineales bacterium]
MDIEGQLTTHSIGQFVRSVWYERGLEYGNPYFNERFRVNAPETSLTPAWMYRSEARENGMMLIRIEEDLALIEAVELYAEIWGGHPGTVDKRLTINGRSTYPLPEVGTAAGHCTYSYPSIPFKLTDIVNGYNAIQFACDMGTGFWGHYIVDNAALDMVLKRGHPDLEAARLADFTATVAWEHLSDQAEAVNLALVCPDAYHDKISHVDFVGYYSGYDENGNGTGCDWHGFTKNRAPAAHIGTAAHPPFSTSWDTTMLTAQNDIAVRAVVHFRDVPDLVYKTPASIGWKIPQRKRNLVTYHLAANQPQPFWSRDGNLRECTVILDDAPDDIEQAELHVLIWDGGAGTTKKPLTLNGHDLPVASSGAHDVLYRKITIQPRQLQGGMNTISLLSDTEHHGIEILLPGPCLVLRRCKEQ